MEFFSLGGGGEQAIIYDLLIVLCLGQVKSGGRTPPYPPVPPALYCSPHSVKLKMLVIDVNLFFAQKRTFCQTVIGKYVREQDMQKSCLSYNAYIYFNDNNFKCKISKLQRNSPEKA